MHLGDAALVCSKWELFIQSFHAVSSYKCTRGSSYAQICVSGRERFCSYGSFAFCLSTVTSSREAWSQGVLPNECQPVLGPGPGGSDRELVKIAASWHAPRGGQWIPGSDLEQSGIGWGGWARQPSSLQRPSPPAQSRTCCRLPLTAASTKPEQTASSTAWPGRSAGLSCFWGHSSDPNSKDFTRCQMRWTCQQMHQMFGLPPDLKKCKNLEGNKLCRFFPL